MFEAPLSPTNADAAVHDYYPQRRLMDLVTIKGDRPFGAGEVAKSSELRRLNNPRLHSSKDRPMRQFERN
jgi:taurine dioxygenase